jgi:integrase
MIKLVAGTGSRCSELIALEWHDVRLDSEPQTR